jgi:hypothetical protein
MDAEVEIVAGCGDDWRGIGDDIAAQMVVPATWTWDDVDPVFRSVGTVSLATWTDALKPFGLIPQP